MLLVRQPFDVTAPFIVASEELVCGGRRLRRGEAFPWSEFGLTEQDLGTLWSAFKVDVGDPTIQRFTVTPGETVSVATPAQQRNRRGR